MRVDLSAVLTDVLTDDALTLVLEQVKSWHLVCAVAAACRRLHALCAPALLPLRATVVDAVLAHVPSGDIGAFAAVCRAWAHLARGKQMEEDEARRWWTNATCSVARLEWAMGAPEPYSPELFGFYDAARRNDRATFDFFLHRTDVELCTLVAEGVAQSGDVDFVCYVLDVITRRVEGGAMTPLEALDRHMHMIDGAMHGDHVDILRLLPPEAHGEEDVLKRTLAIAVVTGAEGTVRFYLEEAPPSVRDEALMLLRRGAPLFARYALAAGRVGVMRRLLARIPELLDGVDDAVRLAALADGGWHALDDAPPRAYSPVEAVAWLVRERGAPLTEECIHGCLRGREWEPRSEVERARRHADRIEVLEWMATRVPCAEWGGAEAWWCALSDVGDPPSTLLLDWMARQPGLCAHVVSCDGLGDTSLTLAVCTASDVHERAPKLRWLLNRGCPMHPSIVLCGEM